MRRSERRRLRGFSYVWTLLLVAGIGASMALAIEIAATATQRDKEKELLAIGRQFRSALARYYQASPNGAKPEYPESLEQLLRDDRLPGIRRHLRKIFVDPMTGKPEWGLIRVGGRIVGVHSLSEKMPIKQDGFQAEDMQFRGRQKYAEWAFTYPADALAQIEAGLVKPGAMPTLPAPAESTAPPPVKEDAKP